MEWIVPIFFTLAPGIMFSRAFMRIVSEWATAYHRYRREPTYDNRDIYYMVFKMELLFTALLFVTLITTGAKAADGQPDYLARLVSLVAMYAIYRIADVDTRIWNHRERIEEERKQNATTLNQEEGI